MAEADLDHLREMARRIRVEVVRSVYHARAGHLGGPLSAADLLAVLYFHELRIRPDDPAWPDRDRFVLSKGHSSIALYAAMALRGYFPVDELLTFDAARSRLQGHPDMTRLPGLDMSTGSLGMGISAAMGMALGARLTGHDVRAFVMLGDGECQEGEVWEAAMAAPRYGLDNLVAIVDHNRLQQYGWPGNGPDGRIPPQAPGELAAKWHAFGWRVLEVDGHDIAAIVAVLAEARLGDGRPVAIVAHTVKGKGVSFMEGRWYLAHARDQARGARRRDARAGRAGRSRRGSVPMSLAMGRPQREIFGETLAEIADRDERIVVVDGDVGSSTRADIFEKAHPDRYLQMGIAEQNMLGVAAGLATMGLVPFVSTFVSFAVVRPLDQVRVLIAQTGANVKITPSYGGMFTGQTGMSHIIVNDLAIMRTLPRMVTVAPVDDVEAGQVLRWAAAYEGPCYVRLGRDATPRVFADDHPFALGRAEVVRDGGDVTLISTGAQTARTVEAAELLAADGIDALVLHVATLKPLDVAAVVAVADRTGRVVTVEEHSVLGGLGGAVAEALGAHRPTRIDRIGLQDVDVQSGPNDALLDIYGLSASRVAGQVAALLEADGEAESDLARFGLAGMAG